MSGSPIVFVALDRRIVEQLLPGALSEAEAAEASCRSGSRRRARVAGALGVDLEELLAEWLLLSPNSDTERRVV